MKVSPLFIALAFICAGGPTAGSLYGQSGTTTFEARFVNDSLPISAQFSYSIESGDVQPAGTVHHFTWKKPTEVQIKFSNLKWNGEISESDKRNLILSMEIGGNAASTMAFGMNESQYHRLSLKQGPATKLDLQLRAITPQGNTIFSDRNLTLTFTPKTAPPPPENEKGKMEKPEQQQISEPNREDKAWTEAKRSNSVQAYSSFLSEFPSPKGKYYKSAKEAIIRVDVLKKSVSRINDSTEFVSVSNLLNAPWMEVYPASFPKPDGKFNKNSYTYEFSASILSPGIDSIRICDHDPGKKGVRCLVHKFGVMFLPLSGQFQLSDKGDSFQLVVSGGVAPFRLVFLDPGGWEKDIIEFIHARDTALSIAELGKKLEPGAYAIEIQDAESAFYKTENTPLVIKKQIPRVWFIGGGAMALLLVVAFVVRSILKVNQQHRREELLKQAQSNAISGLGVIADADIKPDSDHTSIPETPIVSSSDIKIRPRSNSKEITFDVFHNMVSAGYLYFPLKLEQHWHDSAIQNIYMHRDAISEIGHYLRTENTSKIKENDKDIPEIGGMLLGRFSVNSNQKHEISIDKFVPIASSFSNNVELAFSLDSMARDLTLMQDKYPDLLAVGWFHTHPGHGLFLSPPDLRIQGHFRELYQCAMEIDSLSSRLDAGFFTRRTDGGMNNAEHLKPGSKWFSWREIEQFTSRRS